MGAIGGRLESDTWRCLEAASGTTVVAGGVLVAVIITAMVPTLAAVAEAVVSWEYSLLGHAQTAGLQQEDI